MGGKVGFFRGMGGRGAAAGAGVMEEEQRNFKRFGLPGRYGVLELVFKELVALVVIRSANPLRDYRDSTAFKAS